MLSQLYSALLCFAQLYLDIRQEFGGARTRRALECFTPLYSALLSFTPLYSALLRYQTGVWGSTRTRRALE